jgi:hypothetical protein
MFYVTMTDRFLSFWGTSKDKINKLVFICENYQEAETVYNNAVNRTDQKHINICTVKPYYNNKRYYVQFKDKTIYPCWYKPNYFKKEA